MTKRLFAIPAFLCIALFAPVALSGEMDRSNRPPAATPTILETVAAGAVPSGEWNKEQLREVARTVGSLPEPVASELLWLVMSAPQSIDTINFFGNGLGSDDAAVRQVSLSFLIGQFTDDSRRLLLNTLALEKDQGVVSHIITGLSRLPRNQAVAGLMDIMFLPGIAPKIIDETAEYLRAITGETLPNHPGDWRGWWLDNEERFR